MLKSGADCTVVQSSRQVSCPLRDEAAILNTASGSYYGLEAVGARVWDLLSEPKTLPQLQQALASEYEVAPDRCERDLLRFLAELSDAGLIEVRNGSSQTVLPTPAG